MEYGRSYRIGIPSNFTLHRAITRAVINITSTIGDSVRVCARSRKDSMGLDISWRELYVCS